MDKRRTVALGAALLALLAAAPAAGAREVGGCRVPDSATVQAMGGRLVVWSATHVDPVWEDEITRIVACRRASGARVLVTETLVELQWAQEPYAFTVAGDHVAYAQAEMGRSFGLLVKVFDARRRKLEREAVASWHPTVGGELSRIESLVVTRSGAVAWGIRHRYGDLQGQPGSPREPIGVRALDSGGSRLLDKGGGVDPASLRLDGRIVRWTNADEARSAPLR